MKLHAHRFLISALILGLTACANVKPWERGILAEAAMQVDASPLDSLLNDHTYFSKEAANGGAGVGGGGCGCN